MRAPRNDPMLTLRPTPIAAERPVPSLWARLAITVELYLARRRRGAWSYA